MTALWTEIMNPAELTAFSRVALDSLDDGTTLTSILPNVYQEEVKFSWRVGEMLNGEAEFGEFDTEAPIANHGPGEEKTIRLLPVSQKRRLSEYQQLTNPEAVQRLAEDRADAVVRSIITRLNRARAEALVTGGLKLNENGIAQTVEFGRKAAQTDAKPGTVWSGASADPIADLRKWADMVADVSGYTPDTMLVSTRIATILGTKIAKAGYITGGGQIVGREAVNDVLASQGLPMMTVYDGRANGKRFIEDDRVILAAAGQVGGTVFAPTVESQDPRFNLGEGQRSGIVAGLYRADDPPMGWVLGKAIALPILANPNASLSAKVL